MHFPRVAGLLAAGLALVMWVACGQVYRPVVIPCSGGISISGCPVEPPPTPANFHAVFGISANVPGYPAGAMQIDVAGDSIVAESNTSDKSAPNLGNVPTHAAMLPNNSRLFVASAGSVFGGVDAVSSVPPAVQSTADTGFGPVTSAGLPIPVANITGISESGSTVTVTLSAPLVNAPVGYTIVITQVSIPGCTPPLCNPNAYNGAFALTSNSGTTIQYTNPVAGLPTLSASQLAGATATFPPQPVFVNTTENAAMYVANYNANSVFAINTTLNAVTNSAPVGVNPVSLAETTKAPQKLYVANQGSSTISSLNTADFSANTVKGFAGVNPVWVVARADSQKVYVLAQGDGQLVTIDVATDTVTSSLPVGAGANFIFYDPHLNRLYVTNPQTSTVYVFSDTGANDTPTLLQTISFSSPTTLCPANLPSGAPTGCSTVAPVAVTALLDGSRFYVASYQTATSACPDPLAGTTAACLVPALSVFDAASFTLKTTLTLLTSPPFSANLTTNQYQYAVPPVSTCVSPAFPTLYTPGATRFRVFTTASVDSTRVYVSICDAGVIAAVNTSDNNINNTGGTGTQADTLTTDLPAAFSGGPVQANGLPANQNPVFLLPGQ